MSLIILDIECYHDFFFLGMKRKDDGLRVGVEYSTRQPEYDREYVKRVLLKNTTVGFSSLCYDLPMIWYSVQNGVTNEMLKRASDGIIKGKLRHWEVEEFLDIRIPYDIKKRHIDLIEPQPNAIASLKSLNGRMHGKRMQDLPYQLDIRPTFEQMGEIADYCLISDLDATELLWDTLKEPMDLRVALGEVYGKDFRSKSDSQIGEAIVKKRVEEMTGSEPKRIETKPGTMFRYPVPDYVSFKTPALQDMLARLRETDFMVGADGKAQLPVWLDGFTVKIGQTTYAMGVGGLHSTESNRSVRTDSDGVLVDADVTSQYPSIIMSLGLVPKSLGETFLRVYGEIKKDRLKAKARAKEIKRELRGANDPDRIAELKKELARCTVIDKGAKIQLNGVYGKLGSRYSILHAPHLLISVTITGQLTLLMMIERAEAVGIPVVSANTDGVLFKCPRDKYAGLLEDKPDRLAPSLLESVTSDWEKTTGFDFEFGEYAAVYSSSVNCYYAIKPNGGHKRKGPIGNPWSLHPDDFDPVRGQLMKNPQATICSDAALAKIKSGTPVEETIRGCTDIRQFVTVIKAAKGATWKDSYLGKTVRYYWGIDGAPIYDAVSHETTGNFKKVSKSDGAVPCMMLPEKIPADLDYARYIEEAEEILRDVGYYGDIIPQPKPIRVLKARRNLFLAAWAAVG
jgi:hypothetical protein